MSPVVLPCFAAGSSAAPEGLRANWRPGLVALGLVEGAAGLAAGPVSECAAALAGGLAESRLSLGVTEGEAAGASSLAAVAAASSSLAFFSAAIVAKVAKSIWLSL